MKMSIELCLAAALLGLASSVLASPTIQLKDGSRIEGEIQGLDNGVYTIVSPSLGTVHVAQSNIVRIEYGGDASAVTAPTATASSSKSPAPADPLSGDIQQLQKGLVQDPATMQSIMNLQSDPQIQAVLNDPAIAKAIQEGDYTSLLGNPKIQALEENEHVKELVRQQVH